MNAEFHDIVDGHQIDVNFRPLTNNARGKLEDTIGPMARRRATGVGGATLQEGTAQMFALAGCIKQMWIDGEETTIGELGMGEAYYDEERDMDIFDILLGEIVQNPKNKVLLRKYGFVFKRFLPKDQQTGELVSVGELDPTE